MHLKPGADCRHGTCLSEALTNDIEIKTKIFSRLPSKDGRILGVLDRGDNYKTTPIDRNTRNQTLSILRG